MLSFSPLWGHVGAAWVQAIGGTVGIALAVWLPYKQRLDESETSIKNNREMQRRVCMAFHDELSVLQQRAKTAPNIFELQREAPDEIFDRELPAAEKRFPVFEAMIGRLVEIDDAAVRVAVIDAYNRKRSVARYTGRPGARPRPSRRSISCA